MNLTRAIGTGFLVWALIFLSFTIMSFVPVIKESDTLQTITLYFLLVPIIALAMKVYKASGRNEGSIFVGVVIIGACMILDALITLPYVIIPKGGSYREFFVNPYFVLIGVEILLLVYMFCKKEVASHVSA